MVTGPAMRFLPAVRGAGPEQVLRAVARAESDGGSSNRGDRRLRGDRSAPSLVVAAFARAKLLGIKILTIDARVVIAPADPGSSASTVATRTRRVSPLVYGPAPRTGQRADLAYAVRLLEEGSKSLNETRASQSLDAVSPK
jgi:hypothetical protein